MRRKPKRITIGRRGIAMILVLGMLALMLIMATAFSVMMRTEHAGAGNFSDEIRSKHVVWAALADAVANIEANIPDTDLYPAWEGLGPQGTDLSQNTGTVQVNVVWGKAGDFVPGRLYDLAADAYSDWVVDYTSGVRYSYLVLNCSGLLDGNYAGGSNRMAGVHPKELYIANLQDVRSTADLAARRDLDVRYESLQEFNLYQGEDSGMGGGISNSYSESFVIGSYWPHGWWNGSATHNVETNQMDISGDPATFAKNLFIDQFDKACGGEVDGAFVYDQLVEYLDDDSELSDKASALTELVPMFNEVQLAYRFETTRVRYRVRTEWIFPFLKPSTHDFFIEQEAMADVYTNGVLVVSKQADSGTADSDYGGETNYINTVQGPSFEIALPLPLTDGTPIKLDVWVQLRMHLDSASGPVVDEVPSPWGATPVEAGFALSATNVVGSGTIQQSASYEVIDPRFNWDVAEWEHQLTTESMGDANIATTNHFDRIINSPGRVKYDRDAVMHVSDAEQLYSVAEMGHLLCKGENRKANYYRTIRTYSLEPSDFHDLFRYFTVKKDPSYGLVNINTEYEDILRCAITNLPMGYPESPRKISDSDVDTIVDTIFSGGNMSTFSDLCSNTTWRTVLPDWSEAERDAMLAYTSGLLGTRQNLFTIIIMGGPAEQGMGQTGRQKHGWFGLRRAVAVVWRDPFPIEGTGSGPDNPLRHRYVLRSFNWLDE